MLAAGRSLRSWIYHVSIIIALAGSALGDGAVLSPQPSSEDSTQLAGHTATVTTCPVRNLWEVEAELFQFSVCLETRWGRGHVLSSVSGSSVTSGAENSTGAVSSGSTPEGTASATTQENAEQEQEQDTDSLLDSASFLSFEEWKKQNLAKVGQSAENVGGSRRSGAVGKEDRRQPTGINNALDSLGDDAEIELDFGGFGAESPEASPTAWSTPIPSREGGHATHADGETDLDVHANAVPQTETSRRKDAGTTCKERFNYASFDCAATVLKTNPECKDSSSVLIENKDSYMLNECRAQNKFLILELCDDILVDTVVLANYEFFSSIFHTFRVSVSDRYPAKPDQWKELGVYEARNTREVQAFAVENSLIWARYLKIEFLTHYGHEFYCPVSLIRVHGTTMMEEYKHDESAGRRDDELPGPIETGELPSEVKAEHVEAPADVHDEAKAPAPQAWEFCALPFSQLEPPYNSSQICDINDGPPKPTISNSSAPTGQTHPSLDINSTTPTRDSISATHSESSLPPKAAEDTRKTGESAKAVFTTPDSSIVPSEPVQQNVTSETIGKSTVSSKEEQHSAPPESTRPTTTQPPSPNPTTQESFFKSVHKRLQMLESNSTLSLLYIEMQSRILRDAFNKVEKRQLSKTSNFLENLNVTVLTELKEFREQYDHVWRSVALEFEHQRIQYHREVHSLSGQLGVLADELVFQKRVMVIQCMMVLGCFALVLFSRGSVSNYMEFPAVQRMVARSHSLRSSSPFFASPTASPGFTRPASYRDPAGHRRNLSDTSTSSSPDSAAASPTVPYVPPTPTSDSSPDLTEGEKGDRQATPDSDSGPTLGGTPFRSHSTPPVLNGHTTDLDTDEDDNNPPSTKLPQSAGGLPD